MNYSPAGRVGGQLDNTFGAGAVKVAGGPVVGMTTPEAPPADDGSAAGGLALAVLFGLALVAYLKWR